MGKKVLLLIFTTVWFFSCGQSNKAKIGKATIDTALLVATKNNDLERAPVQDVDHYIYTDTTYTFASGKGITIQNSYPKGGMIAPDGTQYMDSTGKNYGFVAFWSRIINETNTPLELHMNFPADSLAIFTLLGSHLKLFLPTDTLTYDKLSSFNYGLTGLQSYFDANFNKATTLQKTINPD